MNRKSIAAALVLVASAGSVLADEITIENQPVLSGQRAGMQMQPQPQPFERSTVNVYADDYNPLAAFQGRRTRAEVRDEYIAARAEVAAMTGEDSGSAWLSAQRHQPQPPVFAGEPVLAGQPVNAQ